MVISSSSQNSEEKDAEKLWNTSSSNILREFSFHKSLNLFRKPTVLGEVKMHWLKYICFSIFQFLQVKGRNKILFNFSTAFFLKKNQNKNKQQQLVASLKTS